MSKGTACSVCVKATAEKIDVNTTHSKVFWADLLGVSEASVRRHYKHIARGELLNLKGSVPGLSGKKHDKGSVTEESTDGSKSVTAIRDRPVTLDDARQWIESSGDNPEDYHIAVKSIAYGADLFSNKMSAWPKIKRNSFGEVIAAESIEEAIDPVAILTALHSGRGNAIEQPPVYEQSGAFVISINDLQIGKSEGGGTPATLERMSKIFSLAEARIEELRKLGRPLGELVVIGGGDQVEGCAVFPNHAYNLDLDRRGQINAVVAIILEGLDRLAPLFEFVTVIAARGNHGENRLGGKRTTLYDNDDTLVFEMAKLATERDPRLQHIEYVIAQDDVGVCTKVAGWNLATTHGDVYGKGSGGAVSAKVKTWFHKMAAGRDPIGYADILVTHHFHSHQSADWGATQWIQTPALDGGSEWFRQASGEYSEAGMLSFVVTTETRVQDLQILR